MDNRTLRQYRRLKKEIETDTAALYDVTLSQEDREQIERFLVEKREICQKRQKEIEDFILAIDDSLNRQIFTYRYLLGYSWGRTARLIGGGNSGDGIRQRCYRYLKDHGRGV